MAAEQSSHFQGYRSANRDLATLPAASWPGIRSGHKKKYIIYSLLEKRKAERFKLKLFFRNSLLSVLMTGLPGRRIRVIGFFAKQYFLAQPSFVMNNPIPSTNPARIFPVTEDSSAPAPKLARRLGLFDATMLVMGGIIGAGVFINPSLVARQVHSPSLILCAWGAGGLVAMAGAFVYAELAALRPAVGGQYAYLREAFHPLVAFLYGWALLLVIQTGGMAAVAKTFGHYTAVLTHSSASETPLAIAALLLLMAVNCVGVKTGGRIQSLFMILKILVIGILIIGGLGFQKWHEAESSLSHSANSSNTLFAFGAALIPVLFAYGGWQTASFVAGEIRDPQRNLTLGLVSGVAGVIVLDLAVNFVCLRVLGPHQLAETLSPASAVMRIGLGKAGENFIAAGIAISTLGFLSQGMLTAPRVYYAMATDGLFFKRVAWVHPTTRVPIIAIVLQGILASAIAWSGAYEQILGYVVSVDFVAFGLKGICIFIFRKRAGTARLDASRWGRVPGHPITTLFFIAVCWVVVLSCFLNHLTETLAGLGIVGAGVPAYLLWKRQGGGR